MSGIAQKYGQKFRQWLEESNTRRPGLGGREDAEGVEMVGRIEYMAGLWYCSFGITPEATEMFCFQLLWGTALYKSSQHRSRSMTSSTTLVASPVDVINGILLPADVPRRSARYLAPSWSWASTQGAVYYEDWAQWAYVSPDLEILGYSTDNPRSLTVKGKLNRLLYDPKLCSWSRDSWCPEFRLDTWEDMEEIARIASGEKEGWVLIIVMEGAGSSKPKNPPWTSHTPKGLVLVADG
jgi:hypothetical protein